LSNERPLDGMQRQRGYESVRSPREVQCPRRTPDTEAGPMKSKRYLNPPRDAAGIYMRVSVREQS
jgi:hypothetical protein